MLPLLLSKALAAPLLLDDVRVVDARGDLGVHDLLLEDGRIAALDPAALPADTAVRDCAGLTVVPGLVDSHVHLTQQPGAAFLPAEDRWSQHLASYLAWGVTTVVDPGITASDARQVRALAQQVPAPRLHFVGPLLGPRGGYPSAVFPELAGVHLADEIVAAMEGFEGLGAGAVKVTMEDGPLQRVWPLFEDGELGTIQTEARQRGLALWVHAMDPQMTRLTLELQPAVLVHASQRGGRGLARRLAEAEVAVITTLDILAGEGWAARPDWLDRRQLALTVPDEERALLFDARVRTEMFERGLDLYAPRWPGWLRGAALGALERGRMAARRTDKAGRFLLRLHEQGVPLVVGSDAGGSPIVPWLLHGPATHLELAALAEAGLEPLETLEAATRTPAEVLGQEAEQGLVEVGKVADLVLVEGDPLADIGALQVPRLVVRAGEARTPAEWMAAP